MFLLPGKWPAPVGGKPLLVALPDEQIPWGEFPNAQQRGMLTDRCPKSKDLVNRPRIDGPRDLRIGEDGLHLGSKKKPGSVLIIEERTDAETVAGQDQLFDTGIPDGHRKLTIQQRRERLPMLEIEIENDFGIGVRVKDIAFLDQRFAQLGIVEDLPVKDNHHASFVVPHGLLAICQVNDGQPRCPHADMFVHIRAKLIGSTMRDHGEHEIQLTFSHPV